MSDLVTAALITAIPSTLAAALGFLNRAQIGRVHSQVKDVEIKVDGRLSELLELTRVSSTALGAKEEKERHADEPGN